MFAVLFLMGADLRPTPSSFSFPNPSFYTYLVVAMLTMARCEYLCDFAINPNQNMLLWGCLGAIEKAEAQKMLPPRANLK